jgi:hypothetical protein
MGGCRTPQYIRYGRFDTIQQTVPQLLSNNGFLILRNHGEVSIGGSLREAHEKLKRVYREALP